MTSKEALEILFTSYHYDGNYHSVIEAREKLEQDLERLEKLEKENKTLTNKVEHLQKGKNRWLRNFKCERKENTKLRQAIKIIKDNKVNIELLLKTDNVNQYNRVRYFYDYADYLTQAKYEQLKEVVKEC